MTLRVRAEQAAARQLVKLKGKEIFRPASAGYTIEPESNLVRGVVREDFWPDLEQGDGDELRDKNGRPAKFCAAYSSSALAVNAFGPFRRSPESLSLLDFSSFGEAQFECKCPTGLKGNPPNLDFLLRGDNVVIGIESKFLEPLSHKTASFKDSYEKLVTEKADSKWSRAYRELKAEPDHFNYLDAAQLVKHSLGLRHTFPDVGRVILFYVYWEPLNADEFQEIIDHRREVLEFSDWVRGGDIRFEALAYPDLWHEWESTLTWIGASFHIAALRERYEFELINLGVN